jgi:cysteine desulfuration protein SufE
MADFASYPEALRTVLETFRDNPNDRNAMLIEYSDQFTSVPAHVAQRPFPEAHRVPHCESESYVFAEPIGADNGIPVLKFHYAVENPFGVSARALASILDQTLSGLPVTVVAQMPIEDIVPTLFSKNISMGKGQGLLGIAAYTKAFAQRYAKSQIKLEAGVGVKD